MREGGISPRWRRGDTSAGNGGPRRHCQTKMSALLGVTNEPIRTASSVQRRLTPIVNALSSLELQALTNVVLPNLLRNLNISAICMHPSASIPLKTHIRRTDRPQEQAAVQAELHVRRARRLCSGSRDMLTDVGCGDEHLRERHGVVGQEVELQVFLRVGVSVDHARDVDDEADRLEGGVSAGK